MNNVNTIIKAITAIETKYNLKCLAAEMQPRKTDQTTFTHTIFKVSNEHKFMCLLIVTLISKTIVLASDTYTTNEIVDKVKRDGNNIHVPKDGVYEMAM